MEPQNDISYGATGFLSRYKMIFIILFSVFFCLIIVFIAYKIFFPSVGKPEQIGSIQGASQPVKYWFDKFEENIYTKQLTYQLVGWAFPEKLTKPLADYEKQIVLINDQSTGYYFDTEVMTRKDVTDHYKDLGVNLDQSGFSVNISTKYLPEGKYNIAILFTLTDDSTPILFRTDYYLIRTADDIQFIKEK
jgi:hypothetical protein